MRTPRDAVSLGAAGVGEGTAANTLKTTNILHYTIAGRAKIKAATDSIAFVASTGTSFTALGASKVSVFFVMIDAAGTITETQGPVKTHSTGAGYVPGAFEWPGDSDTLCCIGAIKVATNASGAFTATATDLSAANQTVTYFDVALDYGVPITY